METMRGFRPQVSKLFQTHHAWEGVENRTAPFKSPVPNSAIHVCPEPVLANRRRLKDSKNSHNKTHAVFLHHAIVTQVMRVAATKP